MSRFNWLSWLRRPARDSRRKQHRALRGERFRPRVEGLEDRTLLSAYLVNAPGDAGSGSGTSGDLRWCITQANSDPTPNTITFNTAATGSTILTHGTLEISNSMTITGPGAGNLAVQRDGTLGAFSVFTVDAGATVTIYGLTIAGGSATSGGGISNRGNLTVNSSTLSGNSASSGAGIYNDGSLTVNNSILSGNDGSDGGAIYSTNNLTINGSTLSGNSASSGGGVSGNGSLIVYDTTLSGNTATNSGAGIYNVGTLTVSDSTLSGNSVTSDGYGGGIDNHGVLSISDSTLSGNSASNGGGIYDRNVGKLTITGSTLSGNSASNGGGIYADGGVVLRDTLVAGNTLADGITPSDIYGSVDSFNSSYNLVGDGSGGLSTDPALHNQIGSPGSLLDPLLAPLGNYGGPTQTMALLPGSPAIDAGNTAFVTSGETDQRGLPRIAGSAVDIGAFEYSPLVVTTNIDENDPNDNLTSLREAITYADVPTNQHQITFAPWVTGTIDLTSALPDLSADIGIVGPGATSLNVHRNAAAGAFSVFTVDTGFTVSISGLTISGGSATSNGGGISNSGTLTVSDSTLSDNTATNGGGIYNYNSGSLTVSNSTLSGNRTTNSAAGIYNAGTLTVTDSTLSGNSASSYGDGGGIVNYGSLTVSNSTLSGNYAPYGGGGIMNGGSLTVSNSTLSGNSASNGGGMYAGGSVALRNTLVAGNTLLNGYTASDIAGTHVDIANSWNNLIGTGGSGGLSPGVQGNQVNVSNPGLAPLGNYGGPTQTMALLPGSLAIDAGTNAFVTPGETDQRGLPRIANGTVDIGAFEYSPLVVTTNLDENNSSDNLTSLREAISYADTLSGHHDITFAPWVTGTIDLTSALPDLSADVGIVGPGADSLTVQRDRSAAAFSVFTVDVGAMATISGLTISGGFAPYGGGIYVYQSSSLTVSDSALTGNTATNYGGGIQNYGNLTVTDSTLSANSAGTSGGGIGNVSGSLTVSDCTLSGNTAAAYGGGIRNVDHLTVSGSTLSGNSAGGGGGGIYNDGSVALRNTLIAGNLLTDGVTASDLDGTNVDTANSWNNLIGTGGSGGLSTGSNDNLVNVSNPLLAPLGNYGGYTQTMALLPGSPAIDAGSSLYADPTDQRGSARFDAAPDIGAFESQGFTIAVASGSGQSAQVNTTFVAPLVVTVTANISAEPVQGGQVTFAAPSPLDASATFNVNPATIGANGQASAMATANATAGQDYSVTAGGAGISTPATFTLSNAEAASLVVTTLTDENDPYDGTTSLREAIAYADTLSGPQTVTFDPGILTAPTGNVIDLTEALPGLMGDVTIQGPGATVLTVQRDGGAPNFSVFAVDAAATATISGLTISGGSATYGGGGIANAGSLTVSDCMLTGNSADSVGGGIGNDYGASLLVKDSVLSGNTALYGAGGGIANGGSLSIQNSTLSDNSASGGGGIANGGGLVLSNSTLSGNTADYGAGLYTDSSALVTLTNVTIANNEATTEGGGLDIASGTPLLHNTLVVANRAAGLPSDIVGSVDGSSAYNLIGDGSGGLDAAQHNLLGSSTSLLDPLLGPLGNYGGSTQTLALLPGSPAIDAGDPTTSTPDQRGISPVGARDIGAFESQGFTIAVASGSGQTTRVNTAFASPLVVTVTANDPAEPVQGGQVTFTAPPLSGASATFDLNPATIINAAGSASVTATANSIAGANYSVTAGGAGISGTALFTLSNAEAPSLVTTLTDENNPDDGATSLREAIAYADTLSGPQTVTFDPGILTAPADNVIDLTSALPDLTGNVTIQGPGAGVLTVQRNSSVPGFSVFTVDAGATPTISGLAISGGNNSQGGGIYNSGGLTVSDSTLSGNSATSGAGIYNNNGTLTIRDSILSSNTATFGGGIFVAGGTVTVTDSTLSGDSAFHGGGIDANWGSLVVNTSILSGNTAGYVGGAIYGNSASVELNTSTLANNTAPYGGGLYTEGSSNASVSGSTISGNIASSEGGGIFSNTTTLHNTLVAGNTLSGGTPSDIAGTIVSGSSYNLIGDGSGNLSTAPTLHNQLGTPGSLLNPLLASLANYGGTTETMALLPGSPAIDAGDPTTITPDQRGIAPVGTRDIGAFESQGFSIAATSGSGQTTQINTGFPSPLVAMVAPNAALEPVQGGLVTFLAPTSGPSAILSGNPAIIGATGTASVTAVANGTAGGYTVTALAAGSPPAAFALGNNAPPPSPVHVVTTAAPAPPAPTFSSWVYFQITADLMAMSSFGTPESLAWLNEMFSIAYWTASFQSQQLARDLVFEELGLTWYWMMSGGNLWAMMTNPDAIALSQALEQNPLYFTPAGWQLANIEMLGILTGSF